MSDSERRTPPKWWQDQRLLDRESETVKAIMRGDYGAYQFVMPQGLKAVSTPPFATGRCFTHPDALKDHDS